MNGGLTTEVGLGADCRWLAGQVALSGALRRLQVSLDGLFGRWAAEWGADEHSVPPLMPASALQKVDYFASFPQLAMFPISLDADDQNLRRFAATALHADGAVPLTSCAPVRDVLTPAACYHFYIALEGRQLVAPVYLTTTARCFRRETHYVPLERQSSFQMREIVCVGTSDEVRGFLTETRRRVDDHCRTIGLPINWQTATDPFFNPSSNPKYLMQRLEPEKTEMIFDGRLAVGSVNFHRNYFGEAFGMSRDGQAAFSGCVAFGLERWIRAFLSTFGSDERSWPC